MGCFPGVDAPFALGVVSIAGGGSHCTGASGVASRSKWGVFVKIRFSVLKMNVVCQEIALFALPAVSRKVPRTIFFVVEH